MPTNNRSHERLEILRSRVDLHELASRFTTFRRSGRQLVGLCPIHVERDPSFYVNPGRQVFYCHGCGAGGDVFSFVQTLFGCDFRTAVREVARFSIGKPLSLLPRPAPIGARGMGAGGPRSRGRHTERAIAELSSRRYARQTNSFWPRQACRPV